MLCSAGVGVIGKCLECWRRQMVNAQATYRWHRLSSDICPISPLLERAGHTVTAVGKDIYVIAGKGYLFTNRTFYARRQRPSDAGCEVLTLTMPGPCRKDGHFNDVLKLDTASQEWRSGFSRPPFQPMAYHSAILVDHELWVIGGNNGKSTIYEAVHVLDTKTLQWRTIRVRCAERIADNLSS